MLLGEWNMDDALAVAREESREEGIDEGIDIGRNKRSEEILEFIRKGYNLADIEKFLTTV